MYPQRSGQLYSTMREKNVDINNISKKEEKNPSNLKVCFLGVFFALVVFLLFKTSVRPSSGDSKLWGKEIDGKRKSVLFHCFSSNYQAQIKEKCCHGTNQACMSSRLGASCEKMIEYTMMASEDQPCSEGINTNTETKSQKCQATLLPFGHYAPKFGPLEAIIKISLLQV